MNASPSPLRLRVLEAAEKLGYVANRSARILKDGASRTLDPYRQQRQSLLFTLVKAIEKVIHAAELHCYVVDAVEDGLYAVERESQFVGSLLELRVAGIVLTYIPTEENLRKLVCLAVASRLCRLRDAGGVRSMPVGPDRQPAGQSFRRAALRGPWLQDLALCWPYRDMDQPPCSRSRLPRSSTRIRSPGRSVEGATIAHRLDAIRHFLMDRPKSAWPRALFASNEPLLNGSLRAFRTLDIRVPLEIGVVGFDDFAWADLLEPPITTVDQHIEEIGRMAGEEMLALLEESRRGDPAAAHGPDAMRSGILWGADARQAHRSGLRIGDSFGSYNINV